MTARTRLPKALIAALAAIVAASCGDKGGGEECGNDDLEGDEVCDGADLGGATCESLSLGTGTLACSSDCSAIVTTGCTGVCGNAVIDGGEPCDGTDLGTPARTCADEGFTGGTIACLTDCTGFDTTGCNNDPECGDGAIEGDEVCDGTNLGAPARTCMDEGFRGGTLACLFTCLAFDTTACTDTADCGNGAIEFPEECDGSVPTGVDCTARGYTSGTVTCSAMCTLDTSACVAEWCGDGTINGAEECEGDDLGTPAATCTGEGFTGGTIDCTAACMLDVSACTGGCGNGVLETGETCDGADVGTATCVGEGFVAGVLGCLGDCSALDTTGCAGTAVCTPDGGTVGTLEPGEMAVITGDTTAATDDVSLSCTDTTATKDLAWEIVLPEGGRLTVGTDNTWHVIGLVADAAAAGDCFSDELQCHDPYYEGQPVDFGVLDPGRYWLVVSDWGSDTSLAFQAVVSLTAPGGEVCSGLGDDDGDGDADCADSDCASSVFCGGEASCTDGTDEDLDFAIDCLDTDCMGTAECSLTDCAADHDFGVLALGTPVSHTIDTTATASTLTLSCSAVNGNDYVYSFTLDAPGMVYTSIDQATGTGHTTAFTVPSGAGSGCADAEMFCLDLTASDAAPDASGYLTYPDPLPAGTYFFIVEAAGTAGNITVSFEVRPQTETNCADGADDDGDTYVDCADTDCAGTTDCVESLCGDTLDNDGDGNADCEDTDCIGTAGCTGSDCVAGHAFGSLEVGIPVSYTIDTSTTGNALQLSCSTTDGNDYVFSFTLDAPQMVYTIIDQESGTGHATAFALPGGTGTACDAAETFCLDLTAVDAAPDASGYLTYPDPLPAGTYYFIVEAGASAGDITVSFAVWAASETNCTDSIDNDGDGGADCMDLDCSAEPTCAGAAKGIYEQFVEDGVDLFDLSNAMITFSPVEGHPAGFVWALAEGIPGYPIVPGTGTTTQGVTLADDAAVEFTFSEFSGGFDFFGTSWTVMNVGSNGVITFGTGNGNTSYAESVSGLFAVPTVAPLWDDLTPDVGGTVTYDEFADHVAVTYDAVIDDWTGTGPSSFQAVLWADGHITLAWQAVAAPDGLVGLSNGGGLIGVPAETNFNL